MYNAEMSVSFIAHLCVFHSISQRTESWWRNDIAHKSSINTGFYKQMIK